MNYPQSYIEYLIQFHTTRDYFECHELLEEYWKEHAGEPLSELWVACIQVAVAQYHERRGKLRGAQLMYESAIRKLANNDSEVIGLDHQAFVSMLEARLESCLAAAKYKDLNLPIIDQQLLMHCKYEAKQRGYEWLQSSDGLPDEIIHRHTKRDRSAVITARLAALEHKRKFNSKRRKQ